MAQSADPAPSDPLPQAARRHRRRLAALLAVMVLLAGLLAAWSQREPITARLIARQLAAQGISARYRVETLVPGRLVLRDLSLGDPARPDFTARRLVLRLGPRWGMPGVDLLRLEGARLYASWQPERGRLSFGTLDRLIYTGSNEPPVLPDLRLEIVDGGGVIEAPQGRIGWTIAGQGHLRDGFEGDLAAFAPVLEQGGCVAGRVSLFARIDVTNLEPGLSGPLRAARVDCDAGLGIEAVALGLGLRLDRRFEGATGHLALGTAAARLGEVRAGSLAGDGNLSWSAGQLVGSYRIEASQADSALGTLHRLSLAGQVHADPAAARLDVVGDLAGEGLRPGPQLGAALDGLVAAGADTLLAPLASRARGAIARALGGGGGTIAASFTARMAEGEWAVMLPQARLAGRDGEALLALSSLQLRFGDTGLPRIAGNLLTGGADIPRISGRLEQDGAGQVLMRFAMAEYGAGEARLAVPDLTLRQRPDGAIELSGQVRASGALPGGVVRGLAVPVDGRISASGEVALWNGCRDVRFEQLVVAQLTLARERLQLCPPPGRPILRHGRAGLALAAGATGLDLAGDLAGTPLRLAVGAVGLAWPGQLSATDLVATLGPPDNRIHLRIKDLSGRFGESGISGRFAGLDAGLAAVPLDLGEAEGAWRLAGGRLDLAQAAFVLSDRAASARFVPLRARDTTFELADGRIAAEAILRLPANDAAITRVWIGHDLASGAGRADLAVEGLTFGRGLQPADLTPLALGVVAEVSGTINGTGRIEWTAQGVSSSGRFNTAALDLAAAFGPVKGASGTIVFTDLLGLTTAPRQQLRLASINPGVELTGGEVGFQLRDGQVLALDYGRWPYLGGQLTLLPLTITIGAAEQRRWVIVVDGVDAARFVEQMELSNIAASGLFDGVIPIVFDAAGNGLLEGGRLVSRDPGGHISYIGQLTYEDLSAVGNFAFSALRDLAYSRAEVEMNGPLTGELVTQVRFDGVRQGATARRNLITRQLGRLPIRLVVNVRAPFYRLLQSMRSLYDPSALRDPRSLGLVADDGTPRPPAPDRPIQPPASEPAP